MWGLVSPDGVAPSWMVGVSASVNLPLHHKVQKFCSGTGWPGWSQKNCRKTVVVVWWFTLYRLLIELSTAFSFYLALSSSVIPCLARSSKGKPLDIIGGVACKPDASLSPSQQCQNTASGPGNVIGRPAVVIIMAPVKNPAVSFFIFLSTSRFKRFLFCWCFTTQ